MTDVFDRAQELEQQHREAAIQKAMRQDAECPGATDCQMPGCGEPIPDARQRLVPGVRFCAECQARVEQVQKQWRRA